MYFYAVVFSKSMSCKNIHVSSNGDWFRIILGKTLHVEGNKIPKANLKCICRFTRFTGLLNLDTVRAMSRTDVDCATPFSCK